MVQKMLEMLGEKDGVTISRSIKSAEIRVRDIENLISTDEVVETLAGIGDCPRNEIKVGPIRRALDQLGPNAHY